MEIVPNESKCRIASRATILDRWSRNRRENYHRFSLQVHMDPHSDVKADVDYQAVLSHMNIHKGKMRLNFSHMNPCDSFF